jgi:hypothetical protein
VSGGTEGERPRRELTPSQARRPDQNHRSREGGTDYRAVLNSIRADQDKETFVADLRQHAKPLLSLAQELMRNRGATPKARSAYLSVGIYLDAVLKMHIFDIDPFASKRPGDEQVQEDRATVANEIVSRVALKQMHDHPDSEAAREVARLGIFAFPWHHRELLQEMWPSIRDIANQSERKK